MKKYCIQYTNAGEGKTRIIKRQNAHEAFIDLIDILDNISNYSVELWTEG